MTISAYKAKVIRKTTKHLHTTKSFFRSKWEINWFKNFSLLWKKQVHCPFSTIQLLTFGVSDINNAHTLPSCFCTVSCKCIWPVYVGFLHYVPFFFWSSNQTLRRYFSSLSYMLNAPTATSKEIYIYIYTAALLQLAPFSASCLPCFPILPVPGS